jgi:CheY-like chemotaxis protein
MIKSKTILIIDDDDDDRSLFLDALKEVNDTVKCLSASNGQDGLNILKNMKGVLPDLIFLDLNMPCLNGKQCLAEIKNNSDFAHIPVIIYSTTKRFEDVEETKKLGAAYFLTKPALFDGICNAIKMLLEVEWENKSSKLLSRREIMLF